MNKPATLVVGKVVKCKNLPEKVIKKLKKDLCFRNPAYDEAVKMGRQIPASVLPFILYYEQHREDFTVPKGYLHIIEKALKQHNTRYTIKTNLAPVQRLDVEFQGELRPYQEKAVKDLLKYPYNFLSAAPASGKTCMACYLIAARKRNTLIVVHNKELLYQWQDRIKQFLNYDCGLIGDGKYNIKPITVAIINTAKNKYPQFQDKFNFLICDEAHRILAPTWLELCLNMKCHYHTGLSGSCYRRDNLNKPLFYIMGPLLHTVDPKDLGGAVLKPDIIKVQTPFTCLSHLEYAKKLGLLVQDPIRNGMLLRTVIRDINKYNSQGLLVSDRIAHCEIMVAAFRKKGYSAAVLSSKMPAGERTRIVKQVRAGKIQVLCSSFALISEGFDVDSLSFLCLATPAKFKGRILQTGSRILRPSASGVNPRIYDFRDNAVKTLMYSGFARDKVYKNLGWI